MFTKSVFGAVLLSAAVFAAMPVFAADGWAHEVYLAAKAGRFDDAQAMMDKELHDHPDSAEAHYVEAQLLGKQGRFHDAGAELNTAERLDPKLSFAELQAIRDLQARIAGYPVTQRMQPVYQRPPVRYGSNNQGGWGTAIVIFGLIALFVFMLRGLMRRNAVIAGGGYPSGYGPGNMSSYGPGMVVGPSGGGGLGSGILGGLATGAAVGAGMVAGEELMHHFTDRDRNDVQYDSGNYQSTPDDMGGNDFGVTDNSSWDGGGGGGDDWN